MTESADATAISLQFGEGWNGRLSTPPRSRFRFASNAVLKKTPLKPFLTGSLHHARAPSSLSTGWTRHRRLVGVARARRAFFGALEEFVCHTARGRRKRH